MTVLDRLQMPRHRRTAGWIVGALIAVLIAAWTGTSTPVLLQQPRVYILTIAGNGSTTTSNVVTPGANGSLINAIGCTNTDTAAYTVQLIRIRSATNQVMATFSVPASSGNTTSALRYSALTATNFPDLPTGQGQTLQLIFEGSNGAADTVEFTTSAVTSGKTLTCFLQGADF